MGEMLTAPGRPALLELQFASEADQAFYEHGESVKSRVRTLYGTKTHMVALATPMVLFRPWVIDYFEQFPALPIWIAQGVRDPHQVGAKQREMIQRLVIDLFETRPKLKVIMRRWGIPQPLRKLHGRALLPRHADTLRRLALMNPSLVSQSIPTPAKAQRRWLNTITGVFSRRYVVGDAADWFVMAARDRQAGEIIDMLDFWVRGGGGFDYRWSWAEAAGARDRWHAETAQRNVRSRYGIDPDQPICSNPLDDQVRVGEYTFHALRTPASIMEEGGAMRHCVGSYVPDVMSGRCAIVSMTEHGKRVATLEINPRGQCRQIRGPCNSTSFMKGVRTAVGEYELRFSEAAAIREARSLR